MAVKAASKKKPATKKAATGKGGLTGRAKANVELVEKFFEVCERRDGESLGAFFAEKAVYHNIPLPPIKGKERIGAAFVRMMPLLTEFKVQMIHVTADKDVVLTERIDSLVIGGVRVDLPVMGAFEIKEGRFTAWRDYFDLWMFLRMSASALPAMGLEALRGFVQRK